MFTSLQERSAGAFRTPLAFQQRSAASLDLLQRLERQKTLEGHHGCVNTVSFNNTGSVLVSGSDDQRIILWNYFSGRQLLSFQSGHSNNIFQARIMPHSGDSTLVTCAADGQVRLAQLREGGGDPQTSRLAMHGSRAHKLALDPLSPSCFYSCGEDGRVFHLDLRAPSARQSLLVCTKPGQGYLRDRLQLHSIHCNPLRPHQFVLGGSDIFTRVYDQRRSMTSASSSEGEPSSSSASLAEPMRNLAPNNLRNGARHRLTTTCHVTCAVFSQTGEIVATYNDENIYLFRSEGPSPSLAAKRPAVAESSLRKRTRSQPEGPPEPPAHPPTPMPARRATRLSVAQAAAGDPADAAESAGGEAAEGAAETVGREEARRGALRRIAHLRSDMLAESSAGPAGERPFRRLSAADGAFPPRRPLAASPLESSAEEQGTAEAASPFERSQPGRGVRSKAGGVAGDARLAESAAQQPEAMDMGGGGDVVQELERASAPREPEQQHGSALQGGWGTGTRHLTAISEDFDAGLPGGSVVPEDSGAELDLASTAESSEDTNEGSEAESSEEEGPQSSEEGPMEIPTESSEQSGSEESEGAFSTMSSESEEETEAMAELMRQGALGALFEGLTEGHRNAMILGMEADLFLSELPEDDFDDEVVMRYTGHRNRRTVKGVSFLGQSDEYVMSGSDDGQIYVWTKADGILRQWLPGDSHVVNCLEPHPALPMSFATSGIDDDIKLWGPTADVPTSVPAWATRIHERNQRSQQPYRAPIPASARRLLLNLSRAMGEQDSRGRVLDRPHRS